MARGDGSILDAVETFSKTTRRIAKLMIVLAIALLMVTAANLCIPIFYARVNPENFNIYQGGNNIYKLNKKTGEVYILTQSNSEDWGYPDWVLLRDIDNP